ncbi:hypothetical protein [Aeromicrobium ginsengisoli]|uniref:hypothetical protein n=1 Tax=Aeromicrobium ginsengisoli TaxID=363867 RepID=UPI00165FADB7|nr:hypothetical protein [Aeromicrobium ginsengisoli]
MRTPRPLPTHLQGRAFSRHEALSAGITPRMLEHPRFEALFPAVYTVVGTPLSALQLIDAAEAALPDDARASHLTRLRRLGLDYGPSSPLHFTVGRDLHLDVPGIFLHRTVAMPPAGSAGVCVEAAYVGAASTLRTIDLVKIGDWLLHRQHVTIGSLLSRIHADPWRPGAGAANAVLPLLDAGSRSLTESETRVVLEFAGLPRPAVNLDVVDDDGVFLGCGDLVYLLWKLLIEYEGRQHAFDVDQFEGDIDRYAGFRKDGWEYVQVTQRKLRHPRSLVLEVHRALVARGYAGPAPEFGRHWQSLFRRPVPMPLAA